MRLGGVFFKPTIKCFTAYGRHEVQSTPCPHHPETEPVVRCFDQMIRALQKIRHYYCTFRGFSGVMAFVFAKLSGTRPLFKTRVGGIRHPVFLRIGTTDASVLRQVLHDKHYDLPLQRTPKFIVDAGANIGLSAVFFCKQS